MTYANVAATMALVFAMGGSAVAADHYLITSTKQISPKVLKELRKEGPKGANGAAGPSGSAGANGTAGSKGERGEKGETGEPGPSNGPRGEKGEAGPKGEQGEAGVKGETGAKGEAGAKGEKGETGKEGEKGNAGGAAAHWRKTLEKAGESKTSPEVVTLEKVGPFTITGHCYKENGNTVAATYIDLTSGEAFVSESTEAEGTAVEAGKEVPLTDDVALDATTEHEADYTGPDEGLFSAETTTGTHALDGASNQAVFLEGKAKPACSFSGYVIGE
jgi:Collagen triple helix repeat (20 copies)